MKRKTLELLVCPKCHGKLEIFCTDLNADPFRYGNLYCETCSVNYSIVDGIPHFIKPEELKGLNLKFTHMYNLNALGTRLSSKMIFDFIGIKEETARSEITERLEPKGGRLLEVSIGNGVNLPFLIHRQDVGEVMGLDISLGQLTNCQALAAKNGWNVDLFLGNGEQLPFRDESFESVFHVGGINYFDNKLAAINEMIRIAKPGARILVVDENEKGAQAFEKLLPGFKNMFSGKRKAIEPPFSLIPSEMEEKRVFEIWKGWMYCVEFRKPCVETVP
jgi:SAM-dependent methyltransferase